MPSTPQPSTPMPSKVAVTVISAFGTHPVGTVLTGAEAEAVLASEHAFQVVRLTLPKEA